MVKKLLWGSVFCATLLAASPNATAVIVIVRIEPPSQVVTLNEVFTVDIVADIPDTDPVIGWGLDFTVATPGLLTQIGPPVLASPPWIGILNLDSDGDGLLGLADPAPPINGEVSGVGVVLATLTFSADAIGHTDLLLSVTPGDLTEGFPLSPPPVGAFADIVFEPGSVWVIPEPTTLATFAIGGLILFRRRRRLPTL